MTQIDYADPIVQALNINMPFYFREMIEFVRKFKARFLLLKEVSCHSIYQMKLKDQTASTRIRSQQFWDQEKLGPRETIHGASCGNLRTGHCKGENTLTPKEPQETRCKRCHKYETTLHIFAQCPFAREVWNNYFYIYEAFLQRPMISYIDVLFSR